jgi:ribosome biogenesis GTPase / thiamine phosphate phosphatase
MSNLEALGWNAHFAEAFIPVAGPDLVPGRVSLAHQDIYRVVTEGGEALARMSGRLRHQAISAVDHPAVGDWVAMCARAGEIRSTIEAILPRVSRFSRKVPGDVTREQIVAANVDTVFLVMGLDGDYNLRRIERYLLTAWQSGAQPVVLLTKADLVDDLSVRVGEVAAVASGAPVHATSVKTGLGVDELARYLGFGRTVALLGSSGVGKSTLINRLIGREVQRTAEVSGFKSRGRHTTTRRELILLPQGGLVIDTPGMRELQLWQASGSIDAAFADIEALASGCRFADCRHDTEPRCAVRQAATEGRLAPERLDSFLRLRKEAEYLDSRQDQFAQIEIKRKWKTIHKSMKHFKPERD